MSIYVRNHLIFRSNKSQEPFQMYHQETKLTPRIEKTTNTQNSVPKDLTSTLIDSNINQISWSNQMKPTLSMSQSKSMGFGNKSMSLQSKQLGFENLSATSQTKPMTLQSSANNWNDLWTKQEETQGVKQLSLSDINDLLS